MKQLLKITLLALALLPALASAKEYDLTFQDNADNEDGFRIERALDGGEWELYKELPANVTATVVDAPSGHVVDFRVLAYNEFGESGYAVLDEPLRLTAPNGPSGLKLMPLMGSMGSNQRRSMRGPKQS